MHPLPAGDGQHNVQDGHVQVVAHRDGLADLRKQMIRHLIKGPNQNVQYNSDIRVVHSFDLLVHSRGRLKSLIIRQSFLQQRFF